MGKILTTHVTDKRVISRTYKEFWQMNKKKTSENIDVKSGPFIKE